MLRLTRRQGIVGAAVAIGLVVILLASTFALQHSETASPSPGQTGGSSPVATATQTAIASASPTEAPSPTEPSIVPSPSGAAYADLDGAPTTADLAHALPMAIMVDDNAIARPQSGMNAASIVYQAPADGGEVRYMLVFQESSATDIGPVRSGRPYFVRWAAEYHPLFGHFGGDADTLQDVIPSLSSSLWNMDALFGGSCAYHRISQRVAPHNAYTNSAVLRSCAAKMGYPATETQKATRPFRDDSASPPQVTARSIVVNYPHQRIFYTYDAATRSYLRSIDATPEIDKADGKRVTTRNIVVLFQRLSIDPGSEPGYARPVLDSIGSGNALVFNEGTVVKATWRKTSATDLTRLYDASGAEIQLVRGRIFIQAVAIGSAVTYTH